MMDASASVSIHDLQKDVKEMKETIRALETRVFAQDSQILALKTTVAHLSLHLTNIVAGFSSLDKDALLKEAAKRKQRREEASRSEEASLSLSSASPAPPSLQAASSSSSSQLPQSPPVALPPLPPISMALDEKVRKTQKSPREEKRAAQEQFGRARSLSNKDRRSSTDRVVTTAPEQRPKRGSGAARDLKLAPMGGDWKVTTWVGNSLSGFLDGFLKSACFKQPYAVAVDLKGKVYIADRGNNRIRVVSSRGMVSTLAGNATKGHKDGLGTKATFTHPTGIAVDTQGNVFVADNDKIRKISVAGMVTTLLDGTGEGANFHDVCVDNTGNLYFSDKKSHRIFKISSPPKRKVSVLAGTGYAGYRDGTGDRAFFHAPSGLAVDPVSGDVFVADYSNHRIRRINASTGTVTSLSGSGTEGDRDGDAQQACFKYPSGIAYDPHRQVLFVVDENHRLRQVTVPSGDVLSIAGTGSPGYLDGAGAAFNYPRGVAVEASGAVFVADTYNHRVRKVLYWASIEGGVL